MTHKSLRMVGVSTVLSVGLLTWIGCDGGTDSDSPNAPSVQESEPGGGPGPGKGRGGPGRSSPIRTIMAKLDRGPAALNKAIPKGLEADPPDWGTIQKQSSEYASLSAGLGKLEPPKGSPESWTKLSAEFAEYAANLDHAAQAKDRDGALKAPQAALRILHGMPSRAPSHADGTGWQTRWGRSSGWSSPWRSSGRWPTSSRRRPTSSRRPGSSAGRNSAPMTEGPQYRFSIASAPTCWMRDPS